MNFFKKKTQEPELPGAFMAMAKVQQLVDKGDHKERQEVDIRMDKVVLEVLMEMSQTMVRVEGLLMEIRNKQK